MTDRNVGFGQTHASIALGLAAMVDGDSTVVFAQNVNGDRVYDESGLTITVPNATLKSSIVGTKFTIRQNNANAMDTLTVTVAAAGALNIQDINIIRTRQGIDAKHTSGTVTVERCQVWNASASAIVHSSGAGNFVVNNSICMWCSNSFAATASTNLTYNYCLSAFCTGKAFITNAVVGTDTSNNCLSYQDNIDWDGTFGAGGNNASTKSSGSSGAPGSGNIFDITLANTKFAYYFAPPTTTLFPFWDFRTVDAQSSVLENAGVVVSGVTDDIDGRTRSVTVPNIGPTEGFLGFGTIVSGIQRIVGVNLTVKI